MKKPLLLKLLKSWVSTLPTVLKETLPNKPAPAGDLLYQTREMRYEVQKIVTALEEQESNLKNYLIETLPKGKANGITGSIARVEINTEPHPTVENWEAFYAYVKKNDAFELLQRRLTESAVIERWENKKEIPGVGKFNVVKVSCTKR